MPFPGTQGQPLSVYLPKKKVGFPNLLAMHNEFKMSGKGAWISGPEDARHDGVNYSVFIVNYNNDEQMALAFELSPEERKQAEATFPPTVRH